MERKIAKVPPVQEGIKRPLWSVMIPVFNRADLLSRTLESVLCQDPGEDLMQIKVLDNHSSDGAEAAVQKWGKGRVEFFRQTENIGAYPNMNVCLQQSRGQLVHVLHSDDFVGKDFYAEMGKLAEKNPEAGWMACRAFCVDQEGEIGWLSTRVPSLEKLSRDPSALFYENEIMPVSVVVRRAVYEKLGGFDETLQFADWEMWVRAISEFGGIMLNKPLCDYQVHQKSITEEWTREGGLIDHYSRIAEIFKSYFREYDREKLQLAASALAKSKAYGYAGEGNFEASRLCWAAWKRNLPLKRTLRSAAAALLGGAKDAVRYVVTDAGLRASGKEPL